MQYNIPRGMAQSDKHVRIHKRDRENLLTGLQAQPHEMLEWFEKEAHITYLFRLLIMPSPDQTTPFYGHSPSGNIVNLLAYERGWSGSGPIQSNSFISPSSFSPFPSGSNFILVECRIMNRSSIENVSRNEKLLLCWNKRHIIQTTDHSTQASDIRV